MKGTFFNKSLEFKLNVNGESWFQGDTISGTLWVKNHSNLEIKLSELSVFIAYGSTKKVQAKDKNAFTNLTALELNTGIDTGSGAGTGTGACVSAGVDTAIGTGTALATDVVASTGTVLATTTVASKATATGLALAPTVTTTDLTLAPQQESGFLKWQFTFDVNHYITETNGSPYVLYGKGTNTQLLGQLQLLVKPSRLIANFIENFCTSFRFIEKARKSKKGVVDIKLVPPAGKTFASMEQVNIYFKMNSENLEILYVFCIKEIDASSSSMTLKKVQKEFKKVLTPKEYFSAGGRINSFVFVASIEEVLGKLSNNILK